MRFMLVAFSLFWLAMPASGEIVRLANGEWRPYLSQTLPGYGPVSQLVEEAFATEGIAVEYVFMPWRRGYEEASVGTYDGTIVWSRTAQREQDFLFSEPVGTLRTMLFHRASDDFEWQTIDDLQGLRIGGVIGYSYAVEEAEKEGRINIVRISDPANNYQKLMAGRLDLVAEDEAVGQLLLEEMGLQSKITFHPKPLKEVSYHVLFSRRTGRGEALVQAFNRGLARLREEGRLDDLFADIPAEPPGKPALTPGATPPN